MKNCEPPELGAAVFAIDLALHTLQPFTNDVEAVKLALSRAARKGNTTLLVGVEDGAVDRATAIAHRTAPGALVITLDLERYERI